MDSACHFSLFNTKGVVYNIHRVYMYTIRGLYTVYTRGQYGVYSGYTVGIQGMLLIIMDLGMLLSVFF